MDYWGFSEKESDVMQRNIRDTLYKPRIYRILNNNIR
jgi:hypothetical protein